MQLPRDGGIVHLLDIDLVCHETGDVFYEITDGDPASARCWTRFEMGRRRGDWQIRTDTRTELRCTPTHFELTGNPRMPTKAPPACSPGIGTSRYQGDGL